MARAAEWVFTGRVFSAEEAHSFGLIDGLGEPDLDRLKSLDPATTQLVKELTNRAPRLSPRELLLIAERLGSYLDN